MKAKHIFCLTLAFVIAVISTVSVFAYSFTDIEDHWSADAVEEAHEKGVVNGYEDGTFRPGNPVSYNEAAAMICRTLENGGKVIDTSVRSEYSAAFASLNAGAWCQGYISCLMGAGAAVTTDFKNGSAQGVGSSPAQRQVIGSWLAGMLNIPVAPLCDADVFTDAAKIGGEYYGRVAALKRSGLMAGYTDGHFGPGSTITRGEFAKVCVNTFACIERLKQESGKHMLEDSLFLKTGTIVSADKKTGAIDFSWGGSYRVPAEAQIVIDGKASDLSGLAALTGQSLVVSFIQDADSVLIVQTKPMVESGKVKAVSTEGDFYIIGILTGSGLVVSYVLPKNSDISRPSVGDSVSFIAQGAEILELR